MIILHDLIDYLNKIDDDFSIRWCSCEQLYVAASGPTRLVSGPNGGDLVATAVAGGVDQAASRLVGVFRREGLICSASPGL